MSKKSKKNLIEDQDEDVLVKGLREIPFRIMAKNHRIEESFFLRRVYADKRYASFFLSSNCPRKFNEAGKVLMTHSLTQIQDMAQEREENRAKKLVSMMDHKNDNGKCSNSREQITYSNVLSSPKKDINNNDNDKVITGSFSLREQLENYSPSAVSPEFKEYSNVDFDIDDIPMSSSEFGKYHTPLVELFLKQMIYDERIIVGIILYGNTAIQKQNRNLYKRFSTSYCDECDAPLIQVPQFPELPLPQLISRPVLQRKSNAIKK